MEAPDFIPGELADEGNSATATMAPLPRIPLPRVPSPAPPAAPDFISGELVDSSTAPAADPSSDFIPDDGARVVAASQWIQQHTPRNLVPDGADESTIGDVMRREMTNPMPAAMKGDDPAEQAHWTKLEQSRFFHTPKPVQGIGEEAGNFAVRAMDSQGQAVGGLTQLAGRGLSAIGLDSAGQAVQNAGQGIVASNQQFQQEHAPSPGREYLDPASKITGDVALMMATGGAGKSIAGKIGERVALGAVGGGQAAGDTKAEIYRHLKDNGIDEANAQHISDLSAGGMGVVGGATGQLFAGGNNPASTFVKRSAARALEGGLASGLHFSRGRSR